MGALEDLMDQQKKKQMALRQKQIQQKMLQQQGAAFAVNPAMQQQQPQIAQPGGIVQPRAQLQQPVIQPGQQTVYNRNAR